MKRITVLMADDNGIVRREFRKILQLEADLEVVGEAKDGHQAVAMAKKLHPALVLMDVTMPLLNGLQATCQILKACPATKVLMLSAHSDEAYIAEAVKFGASGYLIKQTSAGHVMHRYSGSSQREHLFQPVHSQASPQAKSEEVESSAVPTVKSPVPLRLSPQN